MPPTIYTILVLYSNWYYTVIQWYNLFFFYLYQLIQVQIPHVHHINRLKPPQLLRNHNILILHPVHHQFTQQRLQITSGIPAQTSCPTQPQPTHTPFTTLTLPPVHPGDWPSVLINADWMEIISRGPFQINPDFMFPKWTDGKSFHTHFMYGKLINVEKIKRSLLIYSGKNKTFSSFYCKLFSPKHVKLTKERLSLNKHW